jgi:hypothetical protein
VNFIKISAGSQRKIVFFIYFNCLGGVLATISLFIKVKAGKINKNHYKYLIRLADNKAIKGGSSDGKSRFRGVGRGSVYNPKM